MWVAVSEYLADSPAEVAASPQGGVQAHDQWTALVVRENQDPARINLTITHMGTIPTASSLLR